MIEKITGFGVDVAVTRADDLDKRLIQAVAAEEVTTVLDIGCGAGGQSLRLVKAGAVVTGVDIHDFSATFKAYSEGESLHFIQGDIRHLPLLIKGQIFDACSIQRVLHYLTYQEAQSLLTQLHDHVKGSLYVSVTGLETAIGEKYEDYNKPVAERFCSLQPDMAEIFSIHEPLCLYSKVEFEKLLSDSGWKVKECWVSAFGNIKAVCE